MSLSTLKLALGVAAATALVSAISVGCSGGDEASQPTQTPLPSATPTSNPTPTPTVRPVTRFDSGPGQVGIRFGGVQLTDQACDLGAAVSRDGKMIAFVRGTPGSSPNECKLNGPVTVMAADGSGLREIAPRGQSPSWSPDGLWLVLQLWTGGAHCGNMTSVILDIETGEQRVVVPSDNVGGFVNNPWSPDGRFLVLQSCEGDTPSVSYAVFTVDGNLVRPLPIGFFPFGWSTDGQVVLRSDSDPEKCFLAAPEGDAIKPTPPETLLLRQTQLPWETELSTLWRCQ